MMKPVTLSHGTTLATFTIERLAGVSEDAFVSAMTTDVIPLTDVPLNRADNVIGQEFRKVVAGSETDTYQWVILWNGIGNVERIASLCEKVYEDVQAAVEAVGVRVGFSVATLEARWDA